MRYELLRPPTMIESHRARLYPPYGANCSACTPDCRLFQDNWGSLYIENVISMSECVSNQIITSPC